MGLRADSTAVVMSGIETDSWLSTTTLTSTSCSRRSVAFGSAGVELQDAPVFLESGYVPPAHAKCLSISALSLHPFAMLKLSLHLLDQVGPQNNRRPVRLGGCKAREARASLPHVPVTCPGTRVETDAFRQPAARSRKGGQTGRTRFRPEIA